MYLCLQTHINLSHILMLVQVVLTAKVSSPPAFLHVNPELATVMTLGKYA